MNQEALNIILKKHKEWLRGVGGERADLRHADLRGADLNSAYLSSADLRHADLRGADLRHADLSFSDLSNAYLRYACLKYACLSNANLSNAGLNNADLSDADLNWVNWREVVGLTVICVQVDTTRINNQITYIKELDIWITGCFQGTLAKLKTSIEKTHNHNEKLKKRYYRVIDFILKEVSE
ncbi:hypothetical protein FG269_05205 [Listeria monocytogenes]|nr:hypothetical protein [Listeria monocytogenes]